MKLLSHLKCIVTGEDGFILSSESMLIGSITVVGLIVGISNVRNTLLFELNDLAATYGWLNQSYEYSGVSVGDSLTRGGIFEDTLDESDDDPAGFTQLNLDLPSAES